jgi:CRP/FNR family transcriptional regulator
MKSASAIKTIPMFRGLSASHLKEIASITQERSFESGQIIFSEGDPVDGFHIICSGRVKIFKLSPDGKEQILHFFGEGEPIGEVPVFDGSSFPAFAEAVAPTTTFFFPKSTFLDLLLKNPSIALELLAILSRRLHHFTVMIDDISLKEVPARLARYVLHLSVVQENTDDVTLDVSKTQLASILGTIPETLSRALARMKKENLLGTRGRRIEILDRPKLEALAWSGKL